MMYVLRPAESRDTPALAKLSAELGYPADDTDIAERLRELASHTGHAVIVAEAADSQVIGWVHVFGAYRLESAPFAEIGGLIVAASARGSGAGRALVEAAERWAGQAGFRQLRVRANAIREQTHRFYGHLGYTLTKSQAVFARDLQDHRLDQRR